MEIPGEFQGDSLVRPVRGRARTWFIYVHYLPLFIFNIFARHWCYAGRCVHSSHRFDLVLAT